MNKEQKIPTIQQIQKQWDDMTQIYSDFDCSPQSFYFNIVNLLQLQQAKSVLEIGCGRCLLIPYALQLLKSQACYTATDLSPKMIELAEKKIKSYLCRFQSKMTFQQWCNKNNFVLKVANGEQIIDENKKFDRIICNMVLMLTQNPSKMLKSLYDQAEQGCLLGVSVWGNKQLNLIQQQIVRVAKQLNFQPQIKSRSNFHLYKKVAEIAEPIGWNLLATFESISAFPYLNASSLSSYAKGMTFGMKHLSEQQKNLVFNQYMKRQTQRLNQKKQALTFPAEIYIFKK